MRVRTLLTLVLIVFALIVCALPSLMSPAGAQLPTSQGPLPTSTTVTVTPIGPVQHIAPRGTCCGKKPQFQGISTFTGQVAVATRQAMGNDAVVQVIDLQHQSQTNPSITDMNLGPSSTTPFQVFGAASWSTAKLGTVFGVTLDDKGNIYVAATAIYPGTAVGSGGGPGDVYRIDGVTAVPDRFIETVNSATQPSTGDKIPNSGVGLGNIHYSCGQQPNWYVSNFEDGMIYRFGLGSNNKGKFLTRWDHGVQGLGAVGAPLIRDDNLPGLTKLGRRVWGLQTHAGRLYYAVWSDDTSQYQSVPPTAKNSVWSVRLTATGDFDGSSVRKEFDVPDLPSGQYNPVFMKPRHSSPVSDISFGPKGTMLLAERSMDRLTTQAHRSRVLEYVNSGGSWVPSSYTFNVGNNHASDINMDNSAGGCDYDYQANNARVWYTGDALHFNHAVDKYIYGLQGAPRTQNGTANGTTNSLLFELLGGQVNERKTKVGDVEIPCPDCPSPGAALDPEFTVSTTLAGSSPTFTVNATTAALPAGAGFWWQVEEVDAAGNTLPNTTITNPSTWWANPTSTNFSGYCCANASSPAGVFYQGHRYRITRGVWSYCNPWTAVSKTVFMCNNCRAALIQTVPAPQMSP